MSEAIHIINDDFPTFDSHGYATRTRCGLRFSDHPELSAVWPDDRKQGSVLAENKALMIPRSTRWCRRCADRTSGQHEA
jgi:hypothetical protein